MRELLGTASSVFRRMSPLTAHQRPHSTSVGSPISLATVAPVQGVPSPRHGTLVGDAAAASPASSGSPGTAVGVAARRSVSPDSVESVSAIRMRSLSALREAELAGEAVGHLLPPPVSSVLAPSPAPAYPQQQAPQTFTEERRAVSPAATSPSDLSVRGRRSPRFRSASEGAL